MEVRKDVVLPDSYSECDRREKRNYTWPCLVSGMDAPRCERGGG